MGLIVSANGQYRNLNLASSITISEALPIVTLSMQEFDPTCYGVISNEEDKLQHRSYQEGAFVTCFPKYDQRVIINSLGEGAIWVCNIGDPIENGDWITTSQVPGLGMKQVDPIKKKYTVAKATCDCTFELDSSIYQCSEFVFNSVTYRKAFIGCTYHCG